MAGTWTAGSGGPGSLVEATDPSRATAVDHLVLLYDETCPLCVRCRAWLETQRLYVPIEFVGARSAEAESRFADLPWKGEELVIVGSAGQVWVGPAAFLMCLWATRDHRGWAYRLAGPSWAPLAERFFHTLSTNRRGLARFVKPVDCADDRCRVPAHEVSRGMRPGAF